MSILGINFGMDILEAGSTEEIRAWWRGPDGRGLEYVLQVV